jgi:hypothetical protein
MKHSLQTSARRFPEDFTFALTPLEYESLRSQIVTLKDGSDRYCCYGATTIKEIALSLLYFLKEKKNTSKL